MPTDSCTLAERRAAAVLDAVLDVVGARLFLGEVRADGSVRVDVSSAGDLLGAGDESSVVALITRMLTEERSEGEVRLFGGDGRSLAPTPLPGRSPHRPAGPPTPGGALRRRHRGG